MPERHVSSCEEGRSHGDSKPRSRGGAACGYVQRPRARRRGSRSLCAAHGPGARQNADRFRDCAHGRWTHRGVRGKLLIMRLAYITVLSIIGCGSVPDVVFTDPDASIADGSSATEASAPDSGVPGVCPNAPPEGADTCCGEIACRGNCDGDHCQSCEDRCGPHELCCPTGNTVRCRSFDDGC